MTALPDGTYLILNGGQQGRAGFGLATNPNLNAVLYDPSQPVNQRMSVMANTTVDRLYHSEAILLQDGRVLVSGSDPEDTRFPQEYRVEVFVPPYLLSGDARPTFNVSNTDWAYGQSVTITVTSGNTANMRASLEQHGTANDIPGILLLRDYLHNHSAAELACLSTGLVPAVLARWANAVDIDVCEDWR
jgi:hypothetical protein